MSQFTATIQNAWICFSPNAQVTPTYNPSAGLYGCKQPYGSITVASSTSSTSSTTASLLISALCSCSCNGSQ
jgi:hypothetical protein